MSDVAVDLGRCYDRTILRQMNVNGVGDIQCQEHGEMDSLSKLDAKLAVSFFCTRNTKAIFVYNEVVRFDLHVVEVSDIRFKSHLLLRFAKCCLLYCRVLWVYLASWKCNLSRMRRQVLGSLRQQEMRVLAILAPHHNGHQDGCCLRGALAN